jgi:ribonuclease-3
MQNNFSELYDSIGYKFVNESLIRQALTHPSVQGKRSFEGNYERLEFLGDSILGFLVADILFETYPNENEGKLAKRRAAIVCKDSLSEVARNISLGKYLILGTGEEHLGGRDKKANLENALEALIAAIYIDGGVNPARDFVKNNFIEIIKNMGKPPKDPKSKLQEWAQARKLGLPEYKVVSFEGPSHEPLIEVEVKISKYSAKKIASSKKEAEKLAALELIEKIGLKNDK